MSGFEASTGWTHFSPTKVSRYARVVEGQSDDLDERLDATGLDWYPDAHGGLHVKCSAGRLWEILSGEPDTSGPEPRVVSPPKTEWLNVTTLGAAVASPPLPSSAVQKALRRAGLLERVDGKDVPTEAAKGLFFERPLGEENRASAYGMPRPGAIQRLWAFEVVALLKALPADDKPSKPRKPPPMTANQAEFLKSLCEQTGEPFPSNLNKTEASERIDELRNRRHELGYANPELWRTGQEPMTERQTTWLQTLCEVTGGPFAESLSKAAAAKRIEELEAEAGPALEAQRAQKIQKRIEEKEIETVSGPSFGTREAGRLLGKPREDIRADVSANYLVGYKVFPRSIRLPYWQFDLEGKPHPWVPALIDAFGDNGWPLLDFLTLARENAGGNCYLELLRDGRAEQVIAVAKRSKI